MKQLTVIQKELKSPKTKDGYSKRYSYRSIDDIIKSLKPILEKVKCHVILDDCIVQVGNRIYVKSVAKITNQEDKEDFVSVSGWARENETKNGMDESQLTGSASTYARKSALCNLFLLDDSSVDPDSNDYHKNINESTDAIDKAKTRLEKDRVTLLEEIKGMVIQMEDSGFSFEKKDTEFFIMMEEKKYPAVQLLKVKTSVMNKKKLWDEDQFPKDK